MKGPIKNAAKELFERIISQPLTLYVSKGMIPEQVARQQLLAWFFTEQVARQQLLTWFLTEQVAKEASLSVVVNGYQVSVFTELLTLNLSLVPTCNVHKDDLE